MSTKVMLSVAAAAACLAFAVMPVSAAPLAPLKPLNLERSTMVEKTHGWHRKCRRGLNGFHRHVRGIGRAQCTTARNCYINLFGVKVCEWS